MGRRPHDLLPLVGHALWVAPAASGALALVVALVAAVGDGALADPAAILGAAVWLSLVGVPPSLVWGPATALAAWLATAPLAGRRVPPALEALLGAAAGTAVAALGILVLDLAAGPPASAVAAAVGAAATGAAVVALARRREARSGQHGDEAGDPDGGRRPRGRWVPAAVLTAVAWLWTALVTLRTSFWDPTERCAQVLGRPEGDVWFDEAGFPPQAWCLTGTTAVATQPVWHAQLAAVLITASAVVTLAALLPVARARAARAGRVVSAVLLVGVVAAGGAWTLAVGRAGPGADAWAELARRTAQTEAGVPAQDGAPPGGLATGPDTMPAEEETGEPGPPPTEAQARADLDVLRRAAEAAGGDALLWPGPLAVVERRCRIERAGEAPDGADGVLLALTGRFTARDLATAADDVDFLLITQDNEDAAERIVTAWARDGLGTPEPLHGEWWQGPTPAGRTTVEQAHVGFDDGVGTVEVITACRPAA